MAAARAKKKEKAEIKRTETLDILNKDGIEIDMPGLQAFLDKKSLDIFQFNTLAKNKGGLVTYYKELTSPKSSPQKSSGSSGGRRRTKRRQNKGGKKSKKRQRKGGKKSKKRSKRRH